MSSADDISLSIKSINVSAGNGGSHGIVVNGSGPVLINSITPGSAAEKAGLKMYDFIIKVNGNMVDASGADDVMSMLASLSGLPVTMLIARATPTPTKPTLRRRAILKLQTRLDDEPNILPDEAATARKEMGAMATSALAQLSSLDDILGVGPLKSPAKNQVVPRKDNTVVKEVVNISMLHSSKSTHEYAIDFSESFSDAAVPSSDEEDGPGKAYDPLLDFDNDDDDGMTLQEGSLSTVSVKSSNSAKLRRGPSASNRGMLDDMQGAQQALKQFTEFTRDKLDTIDKQKKAKQEVTNPAILSQRSVEIQPQKKEMQVTVPKATTPTDNTPLYSQVKKQQQPVMSKSKEETVMYQSAKKVDKHVLSNDYDELERPHKPFYVNQPPESNQPISPTSPNTIGSPPPVVPSYKPAQRDSFPLSNRPDYISEIITERFGSGDLGGDEDAVDQTSVEPYLTPAKTKPSPDLAQKVVKKQVEKKTTTDLQWKASSSAGKYRETSPPARNVEKKSSQEAVSKAVQRRTSDTRVSPDAKPVARATSPSSKPFTKATSPGTKSPSTSPTRSPEPGPGLKGFSPMRPYEGMDTKEPPKRKHGGSITKLFRSISPKTKDPVWQLADVNTACKGLPMLIHSWQNQHVLQWLNQLSGELYNKSHSKFQQHAITGHTLLRLSESQLKLMGISDSKLRDTLAGVIARLKVRQAQIEISGLMKGGDTKRPTRH